MNPDVTPPTGDATVYVVIALAVATVSLAALAVVKKRKENSSEQVQLLRNEVIRRHLPIPSWGLVAAGTGGPDGEPNQRSFQGRG